MMSSIPVDLWRDILSHAVSGTKCLRQTLDLRRVNRLFEFECTRWIALSHLDEISGCCNRHKSWCIPIDDILHRPARDFQIRLSVENVVYGSQDSRLCQAILEVVNLLQSQFIKHDQMIDQHEAVKTTCEACFDHLGYHELFQGLARDLPTFYGRQRQPLHTSYDDVLKSAFIVAIRGGWDVLQHEFLGNHSSIMFRSSCCGSPLNAAAISGRGSTFKLLLERTDDTLTGTAFRIEALVAAVAHNQEEIVNLLLLPVYRLAESSSFDYAIEQAAKNKRFPLVRKLLRARTQPLNTNVHSMISEVCCSACEYGEDEFILEMLNEGRDFNRMRPRRSRGTTISIAARNNRLSTVKLLLDHGVSVKIGSYDAFKIAAEYGHVDIIRLFFTRGLDAELFARRYEAFISAVSRGRLEVAKFMWSKFDQEEMMRINSERCCIHDHVLIAVLECWRPGVLPWLVNDCHFTVRNYLGVMRSKGLSPVLHAVVMENLEGLRMLFELGADPIDTMDFHVRKWLRWPEPLSAGVWKVLSYNQKWKEAMMSGRKYDEFYQDLVRASPGVWEVNPKWSDNTYWGNKDRYPLNKFT